jgi:hypothetical protein
MYHILVGWTSKIQSIGYNHRWGVSSTICQAFIGIVGICRRSTNPLKQSLSPFNCQKKPMKSAPTVAEHVGTTCMY